MRITELLVEENVNNEKYLEPLNRLLKMRGVNLPLQPKTVEFGKGTVVDFFPSPGQQLSSMSDQIKGKVNGVGAVRWFPVKHIFKSDAIKNMLSGAEEGKRNINKGEVAEGYHATAAFARLIKRPSDPIGIKDLLAVINRLQNSKTLKVKKPEAESDIADEFHLTITLKPAQWDAFKDPTTITKMGKLIDSIITDANEETGRFADRFATNQRFDLARIIGDGVSEESVKKTDIRFENHAEKKWADFSLKVDTTKQIHQVGGGAVKDSPSRKKATPEARYQKLQFNLFQVDGRFPLADISSAQPQILKAHSIEDMQRIAYKAAVTSLNHNLQTDNQEKHFLSNLAGACKYWMGRDEPDIKLKQFTNKGTFILDPHKIDSLLQADKLDLVAQYVEMEHNLPKIIIKDGVSNKALVSIRTYRNSKGYIRNYIEKEDLWIDLTLVKHIPNTPQKAQTQQVQKPQAPDELAAVKKNAGIKPAPATPGIANQNIALNKSKIPMGQEAEPVDDIRFSGE
jgi:hypothetical protein